MITHEHDLFLLMKIDRRRLTADRRKNFGWCPNSREAWTPNLVAKLSFATRIHAKWEILDF
ncbi:MAG: hypothetical protein AB1801_20275, partial [Chloroflexota bacterium]